MIIASAIKFLIDATNKEVVLCGLRHGDMYKQLAGLGFKPHEGYKELEQGFITDKNEFLNREDAYHHAVECNQIERKNSDKWPLFSEDLW